MGGGGGGFEGRSRREFLWLGGATALGLLVRPRIVRAARAPGRSLSLYCLHTGETLEAEYWANGTYRPDALRAIQHALRDHRTDDEHPIDPTLLDVAFDVHTALDSRESLHVVSGYRSPATNEFLRESGHGVAAASYHLDGRALDFFLPDRPLRDVRRAALALQGGGVGYYPGTGFVHVDTGPVRAW
jgi:uncharacterized protein YcbK (DUF882 family)